MFPVSEILYTRVFELNHQFVLVAAPPRCVKMEKIWVLVFFIFVDSLFRYRTPNSWADLNFLRVFVSLSSLFKRIFYYILLQFRASRGLEMVAGVPPIEERLIISS